MFCPPASQTLLASLTVFALFGAACTGTVSDTSGDAAAPDAPPLEADVAHNADEERDADVARDANGAHDADTAVGVDVASDVDVTSDVDVAIDADPASDADTTHDTANPPDSGPPCGTSLTECGSACVELQTSPEHCGGCGITCALGEVCANGACASDCAGSDERCTVDGAERCVDTQSDAAHCGACGAACSLPHSTAACVEGVCIIASCEDGFADCNGDPADGCETDTSTTLSSCGACGASCTLANAAAECVDGACGVADCAAGFDDCNGDPADGCETDTRTASAHCGGCGEACPPGFGCAAGACTSSCAAPRTVCVSGGAPECVDTRTSTDHCGGCGAACSTPNASPRCTFGSCAIGTCFTGYADCNRAAADGCEVDTRSDPAHCGGCSRACSVRNGSPACTSGSCTVAACNPGFGDCNGSAFDGCETATTTSTDHCGGCGMRCTVANGTPRCTSGSCGIASCSFGFADCNGAAADGCEVNTQTNAAHCGGCGRTCSVANGTGACSNGRCRVGACNPGFGDCNGSAFDGCETTTTTNTNHCGGCGIRCTLANATPQCVGGTCAIASCASGFADCNGVASDGCEVNTRTSVAHCGGCGSACPTRPNTVASCSSGACSYTCATGFADCNGNAADGCETAIGTGGSCPPPPDRCGDPIVVPPAPLGLAPFYRKYLDAAGIPVVSSSRTSDAALRVACRTVRAMVLPRGDLRAAMIARNHRVGVMARDEVTTDIPEHADLYTAFPGVDWNVRARGLGATVSRPITTCAEENVLGDASDPYVGENILVHELAHGIFNLGVVFTIPTFSGRLDTAFSTARAAGLWEMTYAAFNRDEYFAEGVQSYFDVNIEASPPNGIHNHVNTRAELLAYDPTLHALIAEVFPGLGALP